MSELLARLRVTRGERTLTEIAVALGTSITEVRAEGFRLLAERTHGLIYGVPSNGDEPWFCAINCPEWRWSV